MGFHINKDLIAKEVVVEKGNEAEQEVFYMQLQALEMGRGRRCGRIRVGKSEPSLGGPEHRDPHLVVVQETVGLDRIE